MLSQCSPGFLTVDNIVVTIANSTGLQRGQIRTCLRFRVALTPPIRAIQNAGKKMILLGLAAKLHKHWRQHGEPKRDRPRRMSKTQLLLKYMPIDCIPARTAMLNRPVDCQPTALIQRRMPFFVICLGKTLTQPDFFRKCRREALFQKSTNLIAKRQLIS